MKSHLQSYPCPLQINSFWNLGFLLGITIILQIITGIFLGFENLFFNLRTHLPTPLFCPFDEWVERQAVSVQNGQLFIHYLLQVLGFGFWTTL